MTIPSPRKFFEIAAFCIFGFCVCIGMIGATALLAVFVLVEKAVDGAQRWRRGRRA